MTPERHVHVRPRAPLGRVHGQARLRPLLGGQGTEEGERGVGDRRGVDLHGGVQGAEPAAQGAIGRHADERRVHALDAWTDQRCERTRDHLVGPARQRGQAAVAEGAPAVTIGAGHQLCSPVASRRTPVSHRCSGLFSSSCSGAPPRLDSLRNGDLVRLGMVDLPAVQVTRAQMQPLFLPGGATRTEPLGRAVEVLRNARRPLVIAGGGVIYSQASAALRRFAEATGIPVSDTQAGKGALAWDHPLAASSAGTTGSPVANALAREANVVLGIGTRYSDFTTASRTAFSTRA